MAEPASAPPIVLSEDIVIPAAQRMVPYTDPVEAEGRIIMTQNDMLALLAKWQTPDGRRKMKYASDRWWARRAAGPPRVALVNGRPVPVWARWTPGSEIS